MPERVLVVDQLTRSYRSGTRELTVLDDVSFSIDAGSTCSIVGPSGSGKSTLLGLCAGLDQPTRGTVELLGERLDGMTEDERARLRLDGVGFVFQSFRLIPTLTALENVAVPLELVGRDDGPDRAAALLERVGLGDRTTHYPNQLSGGEQQRVSIARAFINEPRVLFADEPTGNLDGKTGRAVVDLLFDLNADSGTTLVLVTHDGELAGRTGRILSLKDGRVASDRRPDEEPTDVAVGASTT